MKEIILHAGFHKTATSSIQITCSENQDKLEKLGFYYPIFNLKERQIPNHSLPLHSIFCQRVKRTKEIHSSLKVDNEEAKAIYSEQLYQLLGQQKEKIILSGEGISALNCTELTALKEKMESYGYRLQPIVFVRSPLSFMTSMVQERIKNGHYKKIATNRKTLIDKIENLKAVFPQTKFFPFSEACKHEGGPVGFFLEKIGISSYRSFDLSRRNDSYSNEAIRLVEYINDNCPFYIDNKPNPIRSFGDLRTFQRVKGNKFKLNKEQFENFKDVIEQENEYLKANFGKPFYDINLNTYKYDLDDSLSDEQIKQLKPIVSKLNSSLQETVKQYCENIIFLDKEKVSYIFSELKE